MKIVTSLAFEGEGVVHYEQLQGTVIVIYNTRYCPSNNNTEKSTYQQRQWDVALDL